MLLPLAPMECFCISIWETYSPCVPDCMDLVYLNNTCNGKQYLYFPIRELEYSYRCLHFLSSFSVESKLQTLFKCCSHRRNVVFKCSSACSDSCLRKKLWVGREGKLAVWSDAWLTWSSAVTFRTRQTVDMRANSQWLVKRCSCGGHLDQKDSTFSAFVSLCR